MHEQHTTEQDKASGVPIERHDWHQCSHVDDALIITDNGDRITCLDCDKQWIAT